MIRLIKEAFDKADAFVISNPADIFYLTGFFCEDCLLLYGESPVLFTDSRYAVAAKQASCGVEIVSDYLGGVIAFLKANAIGTVGIQENFITAGQYKRLADEGIGTLFIGNYIQSVRSAKTDDELNRIRAAQAITDKAFGEILEFISPGKTEKEIKAKLEYIMFCNGADGLAFDTIVASGANGAKPHAVPSDKKIEKGEFVTLDFGARLGNYDSDMTRTVAVGEPTAEMIRIYNAVAEAHNLSAEALAPGVLCNSVDTVAREVLKKHGLEKYFTHALGHGVGIEIHELPVLAQRNNSGLCVGNIVTVEPGVYIEGFCGVRIENMYAINRNGKINLTASDKNLIKI